MTNLPSHPETAEGDPGPDSGTKAEGIPWLRIVGIVIAVVVVLTVVALHVTGVIGPGAHGG